MKAIRLGLKEKTDNSVSRYNSVWYRVEVGNHIVSGSYSEVFDYVRSTYGGSKLPIEHIDGDYKQLSKRQLIEFRRVLDSKRDSGRKLTEPKRDFIYTGPDEWLKEMEEIKRARAMLKK